MKLKKFIIAVPFAIITCLFLLGSTMETVDYSEAPIREATATLTGVHTSTDKLEPIEKATAVATKSSVVVYTLEKQEEEQPEEEIVPVEASYEVFVTEPPYTVEELTFILENKKAFANYAQEFYDVAARYGLNPIYLIAKFGLESGWGTSDLAKYKNNIGGWRCNDGSYMSFDSIEDCLDHICRALAKRYEGWTIYEICGKYCPGEPTYYNTIIGLMDGLYARAELIQ